MASVISNQETNSSSSSRLLTEESKKKKRKKNPVTIQNRKQPTRWRTQDEQQNYSSKLIEALRQVRRTDSETESESSPPPRTTGRVVREAADRALAVAAKGRTRWSRAILTNRLKLKFKKKKPRVITGGIRSKKKQYQLQEMSIHKKQQQPALQRKVKVLGRLVPGCQKMSFPVILEEATDYIAALEMQVRTMTALTQLLSVASSTVPPPPPADVNEIGSTRSPNRPS